MSFTDKIKQIDQTEQVIQKHGTLSTEVFNKINYKFRLEWNFNSNSIEGNTLTRRETRTIMVGNVTVEGKPIKDVLEMKQHDDLITSIIKMGKGELNISEKRIREIHTGIMHEEDPEKVKLIGQWKTQPNYLFNYKNERFDFVAPGEVKERMHILIDWINAEKEKLKRKDKNAIHPVQLAFQFHLDYITIHPFYDGNGRTARILTNLILISYGYPPLYIKVEEKGVYYQYLSDIQGYGGNPDLFYDFMAGLLLRSQQIVLDAIEGKSVDEPEDLDKKISMLEQELEIIDPDEEIKKHLTKEVFSEIFNSWLSALVKAVIPIVQKFNRLFTGINHNINVIGQGGFSVSFKDEKPDGILNDLLFKFTRDEETLKYHQIKVIINTHYGTLKKAGLKTFGCNYSIEIRLDQIKYEILVDEFVEENSIRTQKKLFEKLLHKPLSEIEIKIVVDTLSDSIYKHIDYNTKKIGLR